MFQSGEAPIPGYSLLRLLGRGEYGEVWEAEGPGGTHQAIKFIPLQDKKGLIELRSIHAVKLIRHANLIPIHAIWLLDTEGKVMESDSLVKAIAATQQQRADKTLVATQAELEESLAYLVICMSLADGNLQDRLDQALENGEQGIPVEELLEYTRQAAIGLDYLNAPKHLVDGKTVGIQHRDVKPANLLLMGDTVVVGDFGVVATLKAFDATATTALGSMAFMAPESFARKPSQTSDQYALAITYYKLRTNNLPYDPDVSLSELITIHNEGKLDFDGVPPGEQRVLKRATSPDPRARYPSCREMCDALIECHKPSGKSTRPLLPISLTAIALVAMGAFALLAIDPFGWFGEPSGEPAPPAVTAQNYTLTIDPAGATGTLTVYPEETDEAETTKEIAGVNNIALFGTEEVGIEARSENPFIGKFNGRFSVDELSKRGWKIELPRITLEEFLEQVDQLLEEGKLEEASQLYTRGSRYEKSLLSLPAPLEEEVAGSINSLAMAGSSSRFAVGVRQGSGGAHRPLLFEIRKNELSRTPMPSSEAGQSLIESLLFVAGDRQLAVVRPQAVQLWDMQAGSVSELLALGDSASPPRWVGASASRDGRWIAVHDSNDQIRIADVADRENNRAAHRIGPLDQRVGQLFFDPDGKWLTAACDNLVLERFEMADFNRGSEIASVSVSPEVSNEYLIAAAPVGRESVAVASYQSLFVVPSFYSDPPGTFEVRQELDNASVSFLRVDASGKWLLVCTDSNPAAILLNVDRPGLVHRLDRSDLPSIRDARFDAQGNWVVIASRDGALHVLDLRDGEPQLRPIEKFEEGYVQFCDYSADGRYLVASMTESGREGDPVSKVYVWDFQRCQLVLDAKATIEDEE